MAKNDLVEGQIALSMEIKNLAKIMSKSLDAERKTNKSLGKVVAGISESNKLIQGAKSLWSQVFTNMDKLNKAFIGFGRDFEMANNKYATMYEDTVSTFAEKMSAVSNTFNAGIVKNTHGIIGLAANMHVLGKDTRGMMKLIAIQNQIFREDAVVTTKFVESMVENTIRAGQNSDRLIRALVDVQQSMIQLSQTFGPQIGPGFFKAIETITNKFGVEVGEMFKQVGMSYLMTNRVALAKAVGPGGLERFDLADPQGKGFIGLIRAVSEYAVRMVTPLQGKSMANVMATHPGRMLRMGVVPGAYVLGEVFRKGPGDRQKGDDISVAERAARSAANDPLRQMGVLFKMLQGSLVPVIVTLGHAVRMHIFPRFASAIQGMTAALLDGVNMIRGWLGLPTLGGGGGAAAGFQTVANAKGQAGRQGFKGWLTAALAGASTLGRRGQPLALPFKGASRVRGIGVSMGMAQNLGAHASLAKAGGGLATGVHIKSQQLASALGVKQMARLTVDQFMASMEKAGLGKLVDQELFTRMGFKGKMLERIIAKLPASTAGGMFSRAFRAIIGKHLSSAMTGVGSHPVVQGGLLAWDAVTLLGLVAGGIQILQNQHDKGLIAQGIYPSGEGWDITGPNMSPASLGWDAASLPGHAAELSQILGWTTESILKSLQDDAARDVTNAANRARSIRDSDKALYDAQPGRLWMGPYRKGWQTP